MYLQMSKSELEILKKDLEKSYNEIKNKNLSLDMSRGKPDSHQLDLSNEMNILVSDQTGYKTENNVDVRNYGILDGIPEAKRLFAEIFDVNEKNVLVFGVSTLNIIYDAISRAIIHGIMGNTPWSKLEKVRFLCPVPGYDRHFAILENFGIEMISIPMLDDGPDMDLIRKYAESDISVKGMICVPKYSNPTGITFSDRVIKELAALSPKADDFRIYWDNAYYVHTIKEDEPMLNLVEECEKAGNPDLVLQFFSTSKVTYPGAGVAVMMASDANIKEALSYLFYQIIGHDKINQLRHVRFLKNAENVHEHMKKHGELLRPKFDIVAKALDNHFTGTGIAKWTDPNGGYFVSVDIYKNTAKKTVQLCKEAGLVLTGAGATFPYGKDPDDKNVRIAPTFPGCEELSLAMELFCIAAKLAAVDEILYNK